MPSAQAVGLALCVLLGGVALAQYTTHDLHTARTTTYVVQQGDSLWSIATAADKHHDPRDVVAEIQSLNGLTNTDIQPGQTLVIPMDGR
ncbi:hypothetical protein GCM10025857_67810 [Alicyclobacillus contaminans]|uniref:cell division suppressor protein YneA n=1 Tax=Alicyclobacillus contaminans TaxID=392016 RepID=UPI0004042614|nr:LysM peptidoglycan-binding domain-containing protein [Alicyclobacillus contaminans]GMA52027.1 hypothetical protein GCM10025857_33840 [Alicyclobacillus contaminans]GMA55424.1 hypothetical protein GCM10025857_67810 [Alicyclobacillus contaminans]